MFTFKDVIDQFKCSTLTSTTESELRHCQILDLRAKSLGFRDYFDLRSQLKDAPSADLERVSLKLMRGICATRVPPTEEFAYFELQLLPTGMGYYSQWIGWDKYGNEVRVPRPLSAKTSVTKLRNLASSPVYVIESEPEFFAWRTMWKSTAYVREDIARVRLPSLFGKSHMICEDVSTELIVSASAARNFDDNVAVD